MNLYRDNKIFPMTIAIKYYPPTLCLIYRNNRRDKKLRRYRIELNDLANLSDAAEITDQLFLEHPGYLNDNNVEYDQVKKLVEKILSNKHRKSLIKNLDEVNSYIESDNELNKSLVIEDAEQLEDEWRTPIDRRTETIYPRDQQQQISRFSTKHLPVVVNNNDSMSLSMSGMQNFMQKEANKNKLTLPISQGLPIQRSRLANELQSDSANYRQLNLGQQTPSPQQRQTKYIEDAIQNQQSYYMKNNKHIPLPEPLLNRDRQQQQQQQQQYYY